MDGISQEALALWGLVGTVIAALILYFFVSPRDAHAGLATRITTLEAAHQTLALRFEGSHARHDESLENLTDAIERLTKQIERLESLVVSKVPRGR